MYADYNDYNYKDYNDFLQRFYIFETKQISDRNNDKNPFSCHNFNKFIKLEIEILIIYFAFATINLLRVEI